MNDIKYLFKDTFAVNEKTEQVISDKEPEWIIPIARGKRFCKSCSMPMTKPEDFGSNSEGFDKILEDFCCDNVFCSNCYVDGRLRSDVTMEELSEDVKELLNIEATYPDLVSTPLTLHINNWLILDEEAKTEKLPYLSNALIDGQDCDFTGTQWEKEWLADGKVCHCLACKAARKCISDIKLMGIGK